MDPPLLQGDLFIFIDTHEFKWFSHDMMHHMKNIVIGRQGIPWKAFSRPAIMGSIQFQMVLCLFLCTDMIVCTVLMSHPSDDPSPRATPTPKFTDVLVVMCTSGQREKGRQGQIGGDDGPLEDLLFTWAYLIRVFKWRKKRHMSGKRRRCYILLGLVKGLLPFFPSQYLYM